jgi:hypothetical protein
VKRTIVIPIFNGTYFENAFKLASAISHDSPFDTYFYFGRDYPNVLEDINKLGKMIKKET